MRDAEPGILADSVSHARSRAGVTVVGVSLSLAFVSALAMVPGRDDDQSRINRVVETLDPPSHRVLPGDNSPFVRTARINSGDTLGDLLARIGTRSTDVVRAMTATAEGKAAIRRLRAGRTVSALVTPDGELVALDVPVTERDFYRLERQDGELRAIDGEALHGSLTRVGSGTITSSLFAAADGAGLPDAVTMKLAELFGTEIDFHTDIRAGDEFSVLYEAKTRNGVEVGIERILAAEFVNQGRRHTVIQFDDGDGNFGYYTPEGRNLKQAFLRSPLEFSRVTSGFKMRFHPIKKAWRRHTGVDFGAASGTAIKATSNGKVDFVGSKRGYGKTVILKHRNRITTLYAHMSRFPPKLRRGQSVAQGDVIGYVGATGWATGPHLHYEFRNDNKPVDPMNVTLPEAEPLAPSDFERFRKIAERRLTQLATLNYRTTVASR